MERKRRKTLRIKFYVIFFLFLIFILLMLFNKLFLDIPQYSIKNISSISLENYFNLEKRYTIHWYYFAAMDDLEGRMKKADNDKNYDRFISLYQSNGKDIEKALLDFGGRRYKRDLLKKVEQFEQIDRVYRNKIFPLPKEISYEYNDSWGADRTYGGERTHEGIDIIADKGAPVVSVGEGEITNIGWNELGGWRIGVMGQDGIYYYYAHLDKYKKNIEKGQKVDEGDILGYVGNTGYGPEGTSGKFVDHLHFGMYEKDIAVNPYPFLKAWE